MKNLALQGEVCHVIPLPSSGSGTGRIVAVIRNTTSADVTTYADHVLDINVGGDDIAPDQRSKRPPVVFVVTSQGKVLALDENDQMVWIVDLEKVVLDSNEENDEEISSDASLLDNQWFYAGSFMQEVSPDDLDDNDGIGMDLNAQAGLHLTCLSHAGHVVSVSTDLTTSIAMEGGASCEEGSECIGSFENGLECGGWSPDGEILALVTFADEEEQEEGSDAKIPILMTMNTQYEILSEIHLEPCVAGERTVEENDSTHPNAISMCWRPDSSSLAVSTMDSCVNNKPLRRVRTFSTTLQLISLSKEEDGSGRDVPNLLSIAPTWAPAGCSHYVGVIQSSRPLTLKSAKSRQVSMQVAFMEPNGLRHRECKIHNTCVAKEEKEEITGVSFNLEGDLLSVTSMVTSLTDNSIAPYGKLQLYHRSNYHWYLKTELRYDDHSVQSSSALVSRAIFSPEDPYKLTIALRRQNSGDDILEWREYCFRWDSSNVYSHYQQSTALAMSVDGKKLNFTPLDKAMVPPPMCAGFVELPAPVVGITSRPSFYHDSPSQEGERKIEFLITMSNGKIALLQSGGKVKSANTMVHGFSPPSLAATIDLETVTCLVGERETASLQATCLRDLTIIDADGDSYTAVALYSPQASQNQHHNFDNLVEMKISWRDSQSEQVDVDVTITELLQLESRALRIVNWEDTAYAPGARGSALIELNDGMLLEYNQGGAIEACEAGPILEACPSIAGIFDAHSNEISATAPIADGEACHDVHSKRLVVGLSSRYRLYCGERLLSSASSSFEVSLSHKFITHVTIGSRPHLHFLPIESLRDFDPFTESDNHAVLDGYEPRLVERGARLVSIFPSMPSLVLQMPRGNLEGISPRGLVLPYVMTKIQNGEIQEAFDIMRRQRVDLNLIVDLNPSNFLSCVADQLICQIEKIDNINLFISSLIDVDSTFKYPVPSWIRQGIPGATNTYGDDSKVNVVCGKMRELMLTAESDSVTSSGNAVEKGHFLLPILSTFAKESPPKLEEALSLIKNSASSSKAKQSKGKSLLISDYVQSSIQYLAFLSDYELIFNTALGMYDFDLAKAVARHSQMDPKVYLPMLKRLRELPISLACFDVDVKLKRFESALRHLVASNSYNETDEEIANHKSKCMAFIEEHSLHKLGLELFQEDADFYRAIMVSLGERMLGERKSEEALTIFLLADPKCLEGGKRAARECGDWKTYFACCAEDNETLSTDQVTNLAEIISSKFGNMKDQSDAFASAARILQDYCQDVGYAVDMLISGHLWSEGRRVAHLRNRPDLVKKCVDASVTYAQTCIDDLVDRASTFEKTIARYAEVIELRRNAIKEAEEAGAEIHDDSASMFSMASTVSNTSLSSSASGRSMGSVGSVGTVASVSTVISVGATSTFSFTGDVDNMKHKSKFNKIGRDKKKKQKKPRNSRRRKPGGEEELAELVATLTHSCPDEYYVAVISSTLTFLLQSGKRSMAEQLLDSYTSIEAVVLKLQTERLDKDRKKQEETERSTRMEGGIYQFVQHPCEKDIDKIRCKPLPETVTKVLSFVL